MTTSVYMLWRLYSDIVKAGHPVTTFNRLTQGTTPHGDNPIATLTDSGDGAFL